MARVVHGQAETHRGHDAFLVKLRQQASGGLEIAVAGSEHRRTRFGRLAAGQYIQCRPAQRTHPPPQRRRHPGQVRREPACQRPGFAEPVQPLLPCGKTRRQGCPAVDGELQPHVSLDEVTWPRPARKASYRKSPRDVARGHSQDVAAGPRIAAARSLGQNPQLPGSANNRTGNHEPCRRPRCGHAERQAHRLRRRLAPRARHALGTAGPHRRRRRQSRAARRMVDHGHPLLLCQARAGAARARHRSGRIRPAAWLRAAGCRGPCAGHREAVVRHQHAGRMRGDHGCRRRRGALRGAGRQSHTRRLHGFEAAVDPQAPAARVCAARHHPAAA